MVRMNNVVEVDNGQDDDVVEVDVGVGKTSGSN